MRCHGVLVEPSMILRKQTSACESSEDVTNLTEQLKVRQHVIGSP